VTTVSPALNHVACRTPPGTAAIATLAVCGADAWAVLRRLFHPHSRSGAELPAEPEVGRIWLGRLGKAVTDEVVLSVKRTDRVPWVEVHCHGGREVVRLFLELFREQGLTVCTWEELEHLTAPSAGQALAAIALAGAPTVRTAAILLEQYHGACDRAVEAVLAALRRDDAATSQLLLAELARWAAVGRHLTRPWRVAIAGAVNVGKSTLLNALAGYQRSVVAATPGTTRDLVSVLLAIDGWPVEFTDTAGWRDPAGARPAALEEQGIRLARGAAGRADLCLWVLDGSAPPVWPDFETPGVRLVVNKTDLPAGWDWNQAAGAVRVSAQTGTGVSELCQAVARWLVPQTPPPGGAVPFTPELCDRIEESQRQCQAGRLCEAEQILQQLLGHRRASRDT
jgi:tRNA modification GTPase